MAADIDALNYPYIRIRSADWLKRTLLIFPHVVRMTPFQDAPADDPDIEPFCRLRGRRGALLRPANLFDEHVNAAQRELIADLKGRMRVEGEGFLKRFGKDSVTSHAGSIGKNLTVWEKRLAEKPTFQVHAYKLLGDLTDFLRCEGLAWVPDISYKDGPNYLEMHPDLGEAVMATIAVACAENEGLSVVTEFPKLHGLMLDMPREGILSACIEGPKSKGQTSGQQIAEFLVYRRCNVDLLSAESIVALKSEHDALVAFRGRLEELAKTLPPTIFSETHLEERLNDALTDMFREWERDQANLSGFSRRLFGDGVLPEAEKLATKIGEAVVSPQTVQGAASGIGTGGLLGLHSGNPILGLAAGAAAGFAIALVFRSIDSVLDARRTARESPLRYLTQLQEQGVSFTVRC